MDQHAMIEAILARLRRFRENHALLVAISGIDASGKGYLTFGLARELELRGLRVANLSIDGWLNLPHVRFHPTRPAENFYRRAIRLEEMFEQLVLPLRDNRSIRVQADFTEETAATYRKHLYEFRDVDVVLLEGIFLLKRGLRRIYDMTFWVDCSFETALERAIARGQEGLAEAATIRPTRPSTSPRRCCTSRKTTRARLPTPWWSTTTARYRWKPSGSTWRKPGASPKKN